MPQVNEWRAKKKRRKRPRSSRRILASLQQFVLIKSVPIPRIVRFRQVAYGTAVTILSLVSPARPLAFATFPGCALKLSSEMCHQVRDDRRAGRYLAGSHVGDLRPHDNKPAHRKFVEHLQAPPPGKGLFQKSSSAES